MLALNLLGIAGGAAAMKLLNRRHQHTGVDAEELAKQKAQLQKLVKRLEEEASAASRESSERAAQLQELRRQADELQVKMDELANQNSELAQRNSELQEDLGAQGASRDALVRQADELQRAQAALASDKEQLQLQIEALKAEQETTVRELQHQLDELRSRVSGIVSRMLAHAISDAEAAEAVRALGCEIEYIETAPSTARQAVTAAAPSTPPKQSAISWAGQTSLLLEDRQRIERLVVSGMMRNLEGGHNEGGTARIPLVTFPARGLPSDVKASSAKASSSLAPAPQAPACRNGKAAAVIDACCGADVGTGGGARDQQPAQPAVPPAAAAKPGNSGRAPPTIAMVGTTPAKGGRGAATTAGIQFVYSLQGSKGSSWVAKVPVGWSDPSGPGAPLGGGKAAGAGTAGIDAPLGATTEMVQRSG